MATSEAGAGSRAKSTAHTTSRDTLTERKSHDSLNAKHGSDLDVPHLADETDEIDKVLNCLRDMTTSQSRSFPDEKPREYQLSKESWFKFSTDPFVESCREEHKFRISYDAYRSVLTVFPMPGAIHRGLQAWAQKVAIFSSTTWPPEIRDRHYVQIGADVTCMEEGDYKCSEKDPDIDIAWTDDEGDLDSHTVVEIGVSQTLQSLHHVRDLYLMGNRHIHRVILLKVEETPRFKGARLMDIDFKRWEESLRRDYRMSSVQGPLYCQDVLCVGAIKVFCEVWERNPRTGQVLQVFGDQIIPFSEDRQLPIPFFRLPPEIGTAIEPITIKPADVEDLSRRLLRPMIRQQATKRIMVAADSKRIADQEELELATQKDEAQRLRDEEN
ncbi:uncharacterized protein PV06_08355 [Exophiala oligosperma]|uniref:Uncharacterized protein n=1 Tax=Exophiala oligosperma TaxID=215243 RepID=A0A0D2DBA7_9EURO|nr:uncharacterized protein PV06_08355 [Exophiala oligosperma]KIW39770.1 hypothetical protein PV06_08355 [Exophiala oligosperma]